MDACIRGKTDFNEGVGNMAIVHMTKSNFHRHLQEYMGQTLSYEMVKDLMSFVFDMVKDPSVSWVSQDSHIRLLNGIFKKVGQTVDDKCIQGIEESVQTAFIFPSPNEKPAGPLKPADSPSKPAAAAPAARAAAPESEQKGNSAGNELLFRRLRLEFNGLDNRIEKMMELSIQENREAAMRAAMERIDLEARLCAERAELASVYANESAEYRAYLEREQAAIQEWMNNFYYNQDERSKQTEQTFGVRIKALGSLMETTKDKMEALLCEHTEKQASAAKKAESLLESRLKAMEQKLLDMEEKAAQGRKAVKHINAAAIFGILLTAAGFGAVIYFLNVH
jgi:hypothetical protein